MQGTLKEVQGKQEKQEVEGSMPDTHEGHASSLHPDPEQRPELDRLVHEPSRLTILAALLRIEAADVPWLEMVTKLQRSNLSMQTAKLEQAGYITTRKYLKGKFAATRYSITPAGRMALARYLTNVFALLQSIEEQVAEQETMGQGDEKLSDEIGSRGT